MGLQILAFAVLPLAPQFIDSDGPIVSFTSQFYSPNIAIFFQHELPHSSFYFGQPSESVINILSRFHSTRAQCTYICSEVHPTESGNADLMQLVA